VSNEKSKSVPKPDQGDTGKPSARASDLPSGRVQFDDRGNAVWEWAVGTGAFGREVSTARLKKLENSTLSLADDAPTPVETVRANPLGMKKGYNPYDSGKLGKQQGPRKKDLRRLSEWLKLRKQAGDNKDEDNKDEE
jgi:hypothetical protein